MSILSLLRKIPKIRISIESREVKPDDFDSFVDKALLRRMPVMKDIKPQLRLAQAFNEQNQCLHVNHKIYSHRCETRYFNQQPYSYEEITYCCEDCGKKKILMDDLPSTTGISFSSPIFYDDRSSCGEL